MATVALAISLIGAFAPVFLAWRVQGTEAALLDRIKRHFATVKHAKPPASRKESAESYIVATGFRGPSPPSDPDS